MDHMHIVTLILSAFVIFGIAITIYLFFFCRILRGRTLGAMFLSSSVATFAYIIQVISPSLEDNFICIITRYLALTVFAFTLALFVFDYTGAPISFKSWKFLALAGIPGIAFVLLIANPNSPHIYCQIGSLSVDEIIAIDWTVVLVYVILQVYVVGLLITLIYLMLRGIGQKTKLNRINSVCIASGIFLYTATHLMQLGGVRLLGSYSLNMFTYFPTALLALWGIRRYHLADIRPIAYNTIFSQMRDGMLVIDRRGILVDFNPAAEDILDVSGNITLGGPFDPQKLGRGGFEDLADMSRGKSKQTELNGIPYQVVASSLLDKHGELHGYLVSVRDISSQMEVKRLREAEIARKGAWKERVALARALHDSTLQNIGSLIMLCGSVKESLGGEIPKERSELLENLETGARLAYDDLRSLVNELQIDEKPESEFNLWNTLRAKIDFLNKQSETEILLETPESMHIDARQQRELFYLIVEATSNALKHADAKSVRIRFQEDRGKVTAEVRDDGCGFDVQNVQNKGMGLGNMRSRAMLLKGNLSILSRPSEGTVIRIDFPSSNENL